MGGPNPDTLAGPMIPQAALTLADRTAKRWAPLVIGDEAEMTRVRAMRG